MNLRDVLFISDLDGTLLDREARLSHEDAVRINALTEMGVQITYATARTTRSVSHILREISFTDIPVALMNGVLLRDMRENRYVSCADIDPDTAQTTLEILSGLGASPFIYSIDEADPIDSDPLHTYYREITNEPMQRFYEERVNKYTKPFQKINRTEEVRGRVIYFCTIAEESLIRRAVQALEPLPGLRLTYYRDSYAPDTWYMEAFSPSASKKHAVEQLRAMTGAKTVICFGDNRNDIPMFEAADVAVAVSTAVDEAKAAADEITDSVVEYMYSLARM